MRRFSALVLVLACTLQSTGAASASTLSVPSMQPMFAALSQTWIFAVLSGQADRYAAMHSLAPKHLQLPRESFRPDVSTSRFARRVVRFGRPGSAPSVPSEIPSLKNALADPLALHGRGGRLATAFGQGAPSRSGAMSRLGARRLIICEVGVAGAVTRAAGGGGNPCIPPPPPTPLPTPKPTPVPTPTPFIPTPTPVPTPTPLPVHTATPMPTPTPILTPPPSASPTPGATLPPATTGVNSWWTYEERPLPGVGKAMVNVANGNLIVQSDDVDIPERGIDLAFRRTFNSQSGHLHGGQDGAPADLYGNRWTNTFDVHIAYSGAQNIMSVYDLDGARYDFASDGAGGWTPPPGMQGTSLVYDGRCLYSWTKKTGTRYDFYSPAGATCASTTPVGAGYLGRLYRINARNLNNNITFTYSWISDATSSSDSSSAQNLTGITATHSDGQSLVLTFAQFGIAPNIFTELSTVTRPDGAVITYNYTSVGNALASVTRPGNATDDATRSIPITQLTEAYTYLPGAQLQSVSSPRYVWSSANTPSAIDGDTYQFIYDSTNGATAHVLSINDYGSVNFTPSDNTGLALQQGFASGVQATPWRSETFSGWGTVQTTLNDTQGHVSSWIYDAQGRVTQTAEYTAVNSISLVTNASWDSNNNLIASVDPRGKETDYGYDANGNTLWVQQPQIATSLGTGRPTARYSYDTYNNLISSCDPQYVWTSGVSVCPAASGATYYTYNYSDPNEPFGQLTDTYTPMSYHHHITYDSNDYGLPVLVQGDAIGQNDGTVRQPTQTFGYDPDGNLTGYNKGNGAWALVYDSLHRVTQRTDPDNVSSYTCYNSDGSVSLQRSASQFAADGNVACGAIAPANSAGVSMTYDPDGSTLTEEHHHGCTALSGCGVGITKKWYDGADRLVEVEKPQDGNDAYAFPWYTRYIYDISAAQPMSITGGAQSFQAYGNLYKTQECIQSAKAQLAGPSSSVAPPAQATNTPSAPTVTGACTFTDLRGNTFDAVDRAPTKYEVANGAAPESRTTYDAVGNEGLLSSKITGTGQVDTLGYDDDGHLTSETFNDGVTPNRSYTYDPDGRQVTLTSATMGTQTRTYDGDGRLVGTTDPSNELDPNIVTYGYYADGMRKSLSLNVPAAGFNQGNLFTYNYRADGERSSLISAIGVGSKAFAWTYTNAGRELTQSDPITGMSTGSYPIVAKSVAYDGYGRVSALTLPRGLNPKAGFEYDIEDGDVSATYSGVGTINHQITTRDELAGVNQIAGPYANGANCSAGSGNYGAIAGGSCTFDARSGQMLSQTAPEVPMSQTPFTGSHAYTYDAAGREINDLSTGCWGSNLNATRSYDADNHVIAQSLPAGYYAAFAGPLLCASANPVGLPTAGPRTYAWAADGHLANFSAPQPGTPSTLAMSAHWDGDDLLDVAQGSFAGGGVSYTGLTIYIEKLGTLGQVGGGGWSTAVYDRDESGTSVDTHDNFGTQYAAFSPLGLDDVRGPFLNLRPGCNIGHGGIPCTTSYPLATAGGPSCQTTTATDACEGGGGKGTPTTLDASREDGYFDGTVAIQGVRAYDPNMNQWTTPDAYSGDVHDPMSQHPYMWNDNNPVQYSDPSGYCVVAMTCPLELAAGSAIKAAAGAVAGAASSAARAAAGAAAGAVAGGIATVAGLMLATTASDGDTHAESPVEGADLENVSGTGTSIFGKPGDEETARGDFQDLKPTDQKTYSNGTTVGELPNGDTAIVRGNSSDSRATLEIQRNGKAIVKVRYGPKKPPPK